MKFERLSKNKHQKRIIILVIIGIILLIGGITLFKTFALYEDKKEFNVLKGKISAGKVSVVSYVDGEISSDIPKKEDGFFVESVECDSKINVNWDNDTWKLQINEQTLSNVTCITSFKRTLSNYIVNLSKTDSSIETLAHGNTYQTSSITDYRYVGKSPNNYIYFGCEEDCTEENLYRIIGVVSAQISGGSYQNLVKLIKANYYTENESKLLANSSSAPGGYGYHWHTSSNNAWETSPLNIKVLNNIFLNSLGDYKNFIALSRWYLGAPTWTNYTTYTPEQYYSEERSNTKSFSSGQINTMNYIGLMYVSDYGFSLGKNYQNIAMYSNRTLYKNNSWLYQLEGKYYEFTITPEASAGRPINFSIYSSAEINGTDTYVSNKYIWGIRPVFHLKSDVQYRSGNGTLSDPYRIITAM